MIRALALSTLLLLPVQATAQQATEGPGGEVRVLDKVTGEAMDIAMAVGETRAAGYLRITLNQCRYPTSNPSGDAYAALTIQYRDDPQPVFEGWLIASAPALNAMEHPRYDVWVLRCTTS